MEDTNTNWALFYKTNDGRPREFREVRCVGASVWVRSGNVKTRGSCRVAEYESIEEAKTRFRAALKKQATNGFVLARTGVYDPAHFDFEELVKEIREGARKAFTAMRDAHPNENVNAFALVSDDGAMTIVPAGNSEVARLKKGDSEDYLWNTAEWSYDEGGEFMDIAYRLILTQHQGLPSGIAFGDFKAGFIEACVKALEALDKDGFFGTGTTRKKVVVLFQISDSDYLNDAMRRLNTVPIYKRYRAWYKSWN